jgi:hypothetical protein
MSNNQLNCAANGTRYGVIALQELDQDVAAHLWDSATNISEAEAYAEERNRLEAHYKAAAEEFGVGDVMDEDDLERLVELGLMDFDPCIEEPTLEGTYEGVKYMISHLGGAPLLWIMESPHMTTAGLCSPCVPNAGDLSSTGDYECYGMPLDWLPVPVEVCHVI